jgi:hypothetical protein
MDNEREMKKETAEQKEKASIRELSLVTMLVCVAASLYNDY